MVWDCPDFLALPARARKPRTSGLTRVLDEVLPLETLRLGLRADTATVRSRR